MWATFTQFRDLTKCLSIFGRVCTPLSVGPGSADCHSVFERFILFFSKTWFVVLLLLLQAEQMLKDFGNEL